MPTTNPRIQLTLSPHRYDLIRRLSEAQGVSMASVVTGIMDEVYPVLERVCVVLEAAKQAQATSKQGLRDAVAQAEAELLPLAQATLSQFDLFMQRVEDSTMLPSGESGGVAARASAPPPTWAASPEVLNPRVLTGGSGLSTPLPSKAVTTSRKARGTRSSAK